RHDPVLGNLDPRAWVVAAAHSSLVGHRAAFARGVPEPQARRFRTANGMREMLEGLITKFNAKVATDPALRAEIGELTKTVLIELKDGTKFHFLLKDHHVAALLDGGVDHADITISTAADTLVAFILREVGPASSSERPSPAIDRGLRAAASRSGLPSGFAA